jgi:hypothetical protein
MHKPIGVSPFELTRTLPTEQGSSRPSIRQIEQELTGENGGAVFGEHLN